jgi:hypothetical protein
MDILIQSRTYQFSLKWLHYVLISLTVIVISISFLWGLPLEMPMGDSYIHFLYARNLVQYKELAFNPGLQEGIGTSSILWVLVLAVFQAMGVSPLIMAKILGVSFLILCGLLVFELTQQLLTQQAQQKRYLIATAISIVAVCSGSMMWLALSGMETLLFLFLGLLCLWLYFRESWTLLGVALGLLALTRIEGITLAGIVTLVELIRRRRIDRILVKILAPLTLILIPWFLYLQIREGAPISTSFAGRQFVVSEVNQRIITQFPIFYWLQKFNPLIHFIVWAFYTLMYIAGSASLPGPKFHLGGNLVGTELVVPVASILISLLCLPIIYLSLKHFFGSIKTLSFSESNQRLQIVMISWVFVFNLAFAICLPRPGAAGRYVPMNHMLFWTSLFVGSMLIRRNKFRMISLCFVILLFGISINYWRTVYHANIDFLVNVRKPAAVYIDQQVPADARIATTDLGAIGFYAKQPVVDLFGHINKDINHFLAESGGFSDYLEKEGICYLMLFGSLDNAGMDIAKEMGILEDPRFNLIVEKSFSVAVDEWTIGSGPVQNYMPVVNIYRVNWQNPAVCPPFNSTGLSNQD